MENRPSQSERQSDVYLAALDAAKAKRWICDDSHTHDRPEWFTLNRLVVEVNRRDPRNPWMFPTISCAIYDLIDDGVLQRGTDLRLRLRAECRQMATGACVADCPTCDPKGLLRRARPYGGFVMEGQWAVEFEERPKGGLSASLVKGPVSSEPYEDGQRVELVPCDDAAIERAVEELIAAPYDWRTYSPARVVDVVARALAGQTTEEIADAYLRAAGETP